LRFLPFVLGLYCDFFFFSIGVLALRSPIGGVWSVFRGHGCTRNSASSFPLFVLSSQGLPLSYLSFPPPSFRGFFSGEVEGFFSFVISIQSFYFSVQLCSGLSLVLTYLNIFLFSRHSLQAFPLCSWKSAWFWTIGFPPSPLESLRKCPQTSSLLSPLDQSRPIFDGLKPIRGFLP